MEDKIFEMVIESMKQKLIFSDMVEMRKIIKGAVKMMEAHYESKMPTIPTIEEMMDDETKEAMWFIMDNPDQEKYISKYLKHFTTGDEPDDNSIELYDGWCAEYTKVVDWLKSRLTDKLK